MKLQFFEDNAAFEIKLLGNRRPARLLARARIDFEWARFAFNARVNGPGLHPENKRFVHHGEYPSHPQTKAIAGKSFERLVVARNAAVAQQLEAARDIERGPGDGDP